MLAPALAAMADHDIPHRAADLESDRPTQAVAPAMRRQLTNLAHSGLS
jgi:hypothetical protein